MMAGSSANVKDFGATGDGTTDDTVAIQLALDSGAGTIVFPDGTYLVNPLTSRTDPATSGIVRTALMPLTDQKLVLSNRATLKETAFVNGDDPSCSIIGIFSVTGVSIEGGSILGNSLGETAGRTYVLDPPAHHGIHIGNSGNIRVENTRITMCWGDGITVSYIADHAATDNSYNVSIINVTCGDMERNALSMVGCVDSEIIGGAFKDTGRLYGGASPKGGIDLEPNVLVSPLIASGTGTSKVENITITGAEISGNKDWGVQLLNRKCKNISIVGCRITEHTASGGGMRIDKVEHITVTGNTFFNSTKDGIWLNQSKHVNISNNIIKGNDISTAGTGISIRGAGDTITNITQANPAVVTVTSHGYITNDTIDISNVVGMVEVNDNNFIITYISPTSFSIGVDSTGYTAYASAGVSSLECKDINVTGNIVTAKIIGIAVDTLNSPVGGYPITDVMVSGNAIHSSGDIGINTWNVTNLLIEGNKVRSSEDCAIRVYNSEQCVVNDNYIRDVNTGTNRYGIELNASPRSQVNNNFVYQADYHGILIGSSDETNVIGNYIQDCSRATTVTYNGIHVSTSDDCNIQSNKIRMKASAPLHKYGIEITAGSDNCLVTNNFLKNSGNTGALQDGGVGTITAAGNKVS